jgi:hypothetical protein
METHQNFKARYPLATALGLKPVGRDQDQVQHAGFDIDEVAAALGSARVSAFLDTLGDGPIAEVRTAQRAGTFQAKLFSCGHRHWPEDHPDEYKRGAEVHCVYADHVEAFLRAHPVPKAGA